MPFIVFFLLVPLVIWILVVWLKSRVEADTTATPLTRSDMEKGFKPSGIVAWHGWLAVGGLAASLALSECVSPSRPPYTGKWSMFKQAAYAAGGERGLVSLYLGLTCLALGGAFFLWRETKR